MTEGGSVYCAFVMRVQEASGMGQTLPGRVIFQIMKLNTGQGWLHRQGASAAIAEIQSFGPVSNQNP